MREGWKKGICVFMPNRERRRKEGRREESEQPQPLRLEKAPSTADHENDEMTGESVKVLRKYPRKISSLRTTFSWTCDLSCEVVSCLSFEHYHKHFQIRRGHEQMVH